MDFTTFNNIVCEYKLKKPMLFKLAHDKILSLDEIKIFEQKTQLELSPKHKMFLSIFGGGHFGYATIFSLDEKSFYYILHHNDTPINKHLRIADNGCGDYYLTCIENGKCCEQIYFFDHETERIYNTEYADIFEYLLEIGLKITIEK